MKIARLCTLLICAAGLVSHADANQIALGFNSVLASPAEGWVMVENRNPVAGTWSLQGTPVLVSPAKSGDPYIATNFNGAAFTPVVTLAKAEVPASAAANTLSAPDNLEERFSANGASASPAASGLPASATLEQASVPSLGAIVPGNYYLPPIYPFVADNTYYPSASLAFLAAEADAPEPTGLSLGLVGCASLAALAAWRRKKIAA
jgi:hypothetical protein